VLVAEQISALRSTCPELVVGPAQGAFRYLGYVTLNFWSRQIKSLRIVLEVAFVRAVTEGLVVGEPAAADAHPFAPTQAIRLPVGVNDFEIPFDAKGAIAENSEFGSHVVKRGKLDGVVRKAGTHSATDLK
jgi:hypothetical protein